MSEHTVLVGVDGSDNSWDALEVGIQEAVVRNLPLTIVAAYPMAFSRSGLKGSAKEDADLFPHEFRTSIMPAIDSMAEHARAQSVTVDVEYIPGRPADVLIEESRQAQVLVVGSRGRSAWKRQLLGSVSSAMAAHSHCPVIVVPEPSTRAETVGEASNYQGRVVVAIDSSTTFETVLNEAAQLAHFRQHPLTILAVLHINFGLFEWHSFSSDVATIQTEAQATLDAWGATLARDFPDLEIATSIEVSHTEDRSVGVVLSEVSASSTTLVVGSRGRGGFSGMLLGSTSQALLHRARGPIMVIRN